MAMKIKKLGKKAKTNINKSSGGGAYTKGVPAEGINVRLMEEPEDWYEITQYWDEGDKRAYIVTDETPQEFVKDSYTRYILNAIDTDENEVIALSIPKSVAKLFYDRYEKHNTLLDRDFEISKSGSGLKTRYSVTPDSPKPKKLDRYEALDIQEILEGMIPSDEVDDFDEDDDEDEQPRRKSSKSRKPSKSRDDYEDDDDDDDEDEDEEETPRRRRSSSRKPSRSRSRDEEEDDDEDEEEAPRRRPRRRR